MLVTWLTVVCIVNAAFNCNTRNSSRLLTKFIERRRVKPAVVLLHSESLVHPARSEEATVFSFPQEDNSLAFRRQSMDPGSHPAIYCCQAKGRQAKAIIQVPDWVWLWLAYVVSKDPACYAQQTEYGNSPPLASGFQNNPEAPNNRSLPLRSKRWHLLVGEAIDQALRVLGIKNPHWMISRSDSFYRELFSPLMLRLLLFFIIESQT